MTVIATKSINIELKLKGNSESDINNAVAALIQTLVTHYLPQTRTGQCQLVTKPKVTVV